jgi:alanine racemase
MSKTRQPFVQTRRDAWVEVNLGNIEHNIKQLMSFTKVGVKFLAVVKADAYGHGATMIAPTLIASGVDMLGVASVDEGIQLRDSGINAPILVLGSAPSWSFPSAVENDLQLSIFTDDHIKACINTFERTNKKPEVHIKIDTGMHRIGLYYKKANEFVTKVKQTPQIELKGIFTHLACAETTCITEIQNDKFKDIIKNEDPELIHCLNTAGLISYPDMQYDMVRAGIGIYGLMPDLTADIQKIPSLKQCMSLKGRIIHLHELEVGSSLSYGYTFTAEKDLKVATVPVGYADGVPRSLSNKIYGLFNGKKVKQIGNITMDQMMFDVTEIQEARVGDIITLLGEDKDNFISIDEWSKILDTINYEITCRLKVRLPRVYTR